MPKNSMCLAACERDERLRVARNSRAPLLYTSKEVRGTAPTEDVSYQFQKRSRACCWPNECERISTEPKESKLYKEGLVP